MTNDLLTEFETMRDYNMHMKTWLLGLTSMALFAGCADMAGEAATDAAGATNEVITNNQEEGVDEGGIVKNIGDHLTVLRKGRLFAVDVSGAPRQSDSVRVALDEDLNEQVWYDEMLVRGRDIDVVGYRYVAKLEDEDGPWVFDMYSYGRGTTEIAHFYLEEDGKLSRMETQFFESMDYYSGTNYTSRMIGDRLIFYIPVTTNNDGRGSLPRMLEYKGDGRFRRGAPIYTHDDVVQASSSNNGYYGSGYAHALVTCPIEDGVTTSCTARALEGGWAQSRYVTRDDVYLWMGDAVYAMSLEDGEISKHAVRGNPLDQFSFKMMDDELKVVVNSGGYNYYNDRSEPSRIELLSLPREDFDAQGGQMVESRVLVSAPRDQSLWVSKNRFADDVLLLGYYDYAGDSDGRSVVHVFDLANNTNRIIDLGTESLTRIEPMKGVGALLVSSRWERRRLWRYDSYLNLRVIKLDSDDGAITIANRLELDGAQEGEWRSHGFFFKPAKTGGTFGLPIIGDRNFAGWWGDGVSNIAFFGVSGAGKLDGKGVVSSSRAAEGKCETSCVDWYGNTRPIFLRDRIFALMGSELVEVSLDSGQTKEQHRILLEK